MRRPSVLPGDHPEGNTGEDELDQTLTFEQTMAAEEANYERLLAWNEKYDNKVTLVLSLATALFAGIGSVMPNVNDNDKPWTTLVWFLIIAANAPLLSVVYHVSCGTTPNLTPPERISKTQPLLSHVFFGTTARLTSKDFYHQLRTRTKREYLQDLAAQQHVNSCILSAKFGHLASAYRALWLAYFIAVPICALLASGMIDQVSQFGDKAGTVLAFLMGRLSV